MYTYHPLIRPQDGIQEDFETIVSSFLKTYFVLDDDPVLRASVTRRDARPRRGAGQESDSRMNDNNNKSNSNNNNNKDILTTEQQ